MAIETVAVSKIRRSVHFLLQLSWLLQCSLSARPSHTLSCRSNLQQLGLQC